MTINPTISIITVTQNAEHVIQGTILSVLNQTYPNLEYIIVDGASVDDTLNLINKHKKHISLIISEPDEGIYHAMNKGAALAKGDYIHFLNAGDSFADQQALQRLVAAAPQAVDVFCAETNILNPDGVILGTRSELTSRKLPEKLTKKSFLNGQVVSHQAFLVKRKLCIPFNTNFRCSADTDWMIKILSREPHVFVSHEALINYSTNGFSEKNLKLCLLERLKIMLTHFNFFVVSLMHLKFAWRFLCYPRYKTNRSA